MSESANAEGSDEDVVNPCPPEWLNTDDNALLRGDAIGDTVYTHRWILRSLCTIIEALPNYIISGDNYGSSKVAPASEATSDLTQEKMKEVLGKPDLNSKPDGQEGGEIKFLELDSDVEDAACQLWDMTVERDVSLHLLNLEECDILHLTSVICDESIAPRLTEVMVGVVANLCCIEEGCEKVLKKENDELLLSALHLLGSTSDVLTLCEVLRMIRLLLWYRTNKTPNTSWAACPLLKLLCQDYYRNSLTFILINSLSNKLLSCVLELLSNFLFICLPEIGFNIASLYSTEEIIGGLVEVFYIKNTLTPRLSQEERDKILHLCVMCLYSFIDTPGAKIIQSMAAADSKLESLINSYMENEGRVESLEELAGDVCDRLIHAVGLSLLLIPHIRQPSLIMTVGKLLALLRGETRQYIVSRSSSREMARKSESDESADILALSKYLQKRMTKVGEDTSSPEAREGTSQISSPVFAECGWMSPPADATPPATEPITSETSNMEESANPEYPKDVQNQPKSSSDEETTDNSGGSLDLEPSLKELNEALEDYCYQLLAYWWSRSSKIERQKETQVVILDVLDQCHAHEVLFILKAVRLRDPALVPRLQEQILDSGSHQRLVVLLAHMYQ